ncbi:MAG TPA: TetR/AcrR family transcriptional regulator [Acidimicrobiales bacterium]|jgi:AcrR family transcriptional regulator
MAEPASPNALTATQLARRQSIVDASLVLLERNEYDRIQMKDVAEEAGVALGTLYRYFSSKEHLFAEVLVKWAATLRSSLTRRPPLETTPKERLRVALHRSVRAFQHQPQLARLIASLELSSDPFATEIIERLDQATTGVYMELLEGIDPDRSRKIVRTIEAVLDSQLRSWSSGRLPITGVYDYLNDGIDLLFGTDTGKHAP